MLDAIELKALELVNRVIDAFQSFGSDERGQTTAEYVAVTAVGVGLALTVLWILLKNAITSAIGKIATQLTDAIPFS